MNLWVCLPTWFQNLHVGMLSIPVVNDHHFSTCVWNLQYKIITRLPLKDISIVDDDVFVLYLLTAGQRSQTRFQSAAFAHAVDKHNREEKPLTPQVAQLPLSNGVRRASSVTSVALDPTIQGQTWSQQAQQTVRKIPSWEL